MRRRAFTLVELTVVIGVLMLLTSLLIPMVAKAHRVAVRSRMKADIATIGSGLEAFRLDQRDYPRLSNWQNGGVEVDGAVLLCWALVSPGPASQDGADGPGFRLRGTHGTVYGPYINPGSFHISGTDDTTAEILDRNERPIHYCPANPGADIHAPNGFVADTYYGGATGPKPMYDHGYFEYCLDLKTLQGMMGDYNNSGSIEANENAAWTGSYILWCAGPNGIFGPDPDKIVLKPDGTVDYARSPSDDVTNFTP